MLNTTAYTSEGYIADTGAVNAYAANVGPSLTAYAVGMTFNVRISVTNTGPSTLNFNTIAATAIRKGGATLAPLSAGDLVAGGVYEFSYDGTYFILQKGLGTKVFGIAVSDEATALTVGTAKVTFRMPYAMTLLSVRANVNTASSSGLVTVDVNEGGASIFSTTLSIDASEKTSLTAVTPAVISDASLADDAEITIDIDAAGTGAKGLKLWFIGF